MKQRAWDREMAAYTGYVTAAAIATWYSEGLPKWEDFYQTRDQTPSSDDYIERYNSWE
jgi:hypothetical protein